MDAAHLLFAERGFDKVTVAEIADAANVSVKTLFVYFRSKEDLVLSDYDLLDRLVAALASRPKGTAPVMAVADAVIEHLRRQPEAVADMFGLQRSYGESAGLQAALLRRWSVFEDRITEELAREAGRPATATMRFQAIQLVGLVRCATSAELRAEIDPSDSRSANKIARWVRSAARSVGG
ncbi:TetR/AcrR family transcriptional regulator [Mycobacterium sp. 1423905.2]|uniref:TetR/AcrR family transcriptional regulator n=1 Tax=Mycobacterium sp. 1423905.2 TaxID=1856859 RepID=UPI0020A2611E|nr:TetR/AcrR family transcriptional regulator [Mycobacterium sp. 1423905.2]